MKLSALPLPAIPDQGQSAGSGKIPEYLLSPREVYSHLSPDSELNFSTEE